MEILGAFFGEIAAIFGYVMMFLAVYKLFQMTGQLAEIKELLGRQARSSTSLPSAAMAQTLAPLADLRSSDDAAEYAEKLLRAVNAESRTTVPVQSSTAPENS